MLLAVRYDVSYAIRFKKVSEFQEGSRRFRKVQAGSRRYKAESGLEVSIRLNQAQ